MIENLVATTSTSIIKPTIFENEKFGSVRTMTIDNEPWFVGKDVAECLDYKNPRQAIITNVDEDDKGVHSIDTLGGIQKMTIINESGLYSLILLSHLKHLKKAKEFKHWVTSEVLPSIRKTGGYGVTNNNAELLAEIISLRREVAEIKSLVIPTQSNYYLWKNSIATPLVKTASKILGISVTDTYKAIYDDMALRGFNQPYAMNRFCNKYKVDSVSTIDAVADVDDYVRMFMDSVNRFLEIDNVTSDTSNTNAKSEVNNNTVISNSITDYSTLTVEEIIKPLVDLYHDTSINNAYTYKRVYKVMRSDRSWKALMTRRHCKSKKNLVTKFDDIRRDFAKAVNQLIETGTVGAGGVV